MKIELKFGNITNIDKFAQFLNTLFGATKFGSIEMNGIYHAGLAVVLKGKTILRHLDIKMEYPNNMSKHEVKRGEETKNKIDPNSLYLCLHSSVLADTGSASAAFKKSRNGLIALQKKFKDTIVFSDINFDDAMYFSQNDGWNEVKNGYMFMKIDV